MGLGCDQGPEWRTGPPMHHTSRRRSVAISAELADHLARHSDVRAIGIVITMGALAALAGCGSTVNGAHAETPGNEASVTMGGPPPAPGSSATDGEVTVT